MPWAAAEKSALNTGLSSIRSAKRSNTKSRLLLDFRRGAQRVSPVCCGLLLWFRWAGCEKVDQSPHGRDGHAPPFPLQSPISKGQWYNTKIRWLLDFRRWAQRPPVCFGVLLGSNGIGCDQLGQSRHGRDDHAPLLFRCKVQFQRGNGLKHSLLRSISLSNRNGSDSIFSFLVISKV
jgi:hypothetical protein